MLVCHLHWPIETWRQSTVLRLPSQLGRARTGLLREDLEGLGIMDSHQDTKETASSRGRPESREQCRLRRTWWVAADRRRRGGPRPDLWCLEETRAGFDMSSSLAS